MMDNCKLCDIQVSLNSDIFLRNLLRELTGTLETVIGLEEAAGFISLVGQHIGEWMNEEYHSALDAKPFSKKQVGEILVDLKDRIHGDFHIASSDEQKIVLENSRCPFGDKVLDRPSLCMMTSNVFGTITAENLGYAKVCLNKTIAAGDPGCNVTIYTVQTDDSDACEGREYFKS